MNDLSLFEKKNLHAWCIVPFDDRKRSPEDRAKMLAKLEIPKLAYDWRAEHIPTFGEEIKAMKDHGIEINAWMFPPNFNEVSERILELLDLHALSPQLWVIRCGESVFTPEEHAQRLIEETDLLLPSVQAAAERNLQVGLYNHGGWYGEPENQIEMIRMFEEEGFDNVGMVYNPHHGHQHIDRFPAVMKLIKPHLMAFNLNGMTGKGDQDVGGILPLGQGDLDSFYLKTILDSGWRGPVGILNHTHEDAEARLLDNLDGLAWLLEGIRGESSPLPIPRSWNP